MFILSGGFPLISVSQGMVSVLYPSLSSPGGSSAANCCDWRPVPQPSSAGRSGRLGPHKVPGEVARHRTFYLF